MSVGLVLTTKIIDTGFKDRETGLKEVQAYHEYVSLVIDNNKISERRLLAQFFFHVIPSKKLRKGWESYFYAVDQEYNDLLAKKDSIQIELLDLKQSTDSSILDSPKVQQMEQEIERINDELTPTFKKMDKNRPGE